MDRPGRIPALENKKPRGRSGSSRPMMLGGRSLGLSRQRREQRPGARRGAGGRSATAAGQAVARRRPAEIELRGRSPRPRITVVIGTITQHDLKQTAVSSTFDRLPGPALCGYVPCRVMDPAIEGRHLPAGKERRGLDARPRRQMDWMKGYSAALAFRCCSAGASLRFTIQNPRRRSCCDQARSKRSRFITLVQAAAKSWTNFFCASALP
jgi:hypothetical protein